MPMEPLKEPKNQTLTIEGQQAYSLLIECEEIAETVRARGTDPQHSDVEARFLEMQQAFEDGAYGKVDELHTTIVAIAGEDADREDAAAQ